MTPATSMFLGIIIRMYNNGEYNPPHFHAEYQGYDNRDSPQMSLVEKSRMIVIDKQKEIL